MRCFVERGRSGWKAYCVDVDIAAEGDTCNEARAALDRLLERYCYERDENAPPSRAPRRSHPLRRARYWAARVLYHDADAYTRHCYDFHAPPQVLNGLA